MTGVWARGRGGACFPGSWDLLFPFFLTRSGDTSPAARWGNGGGDQLPLGLLPAGGSESQQCEEA